MCYPSCLHVCVPPTIAVRQQSLLFDERRDLLFSVGAPKKRSSGPTPPPPSQAESEYFLF
jgi:hypothetical protein